MLYEVLCGCHPFKSVNNIIELVHKAEYSTITFPSTINISPYAIDLLKRLLKKDPYQRIGWNEFFDHKWFRLLDKDKSDGFESSPNYRNPSSTSVALPIIPNYNPRNNRQEN